MTGPMAHLDYHLVLDLLDSAACRLVESKGWRPGQALFNLLLGVHPALAEHLRGTDADPFYASTKEDPRYQAAIKVITDRWEEEEEETPS